MALTAIHSNWRLRRLLGPILLNLLLLGLAQFFLGGPIGWDAPHRVTAGQVLGGGLAFIQFLALAALLTRCVRVGASRPERPKHEQHLPGLALHFVSFVIYAVLLSAGMRLVFNQSLETVLAASGIVGLVLGFALRGLVSDIFSGIALHMDANLHTGDWLQFQHRGQDITARLLEFDWRSAILHDLAENAILIPNSEFAQLRINNMTRPTPFTESSARIEIGVEHDHARVAAILQNAANRAAAEGHIMSDPGPYIRIANVANGVVPFNIWYSIGPQVARGRARHFVLMHALGFLKAAGIPIMPIVHQNEVDIEEKFSENFSLPEVRRRILSQVPFFSVLSHDELFDVAQKTLPQRIAAQCAVLRAGEPGDSMFVILEGRLDVVIATEGVPMVVASLWPGDCLGEMSLFTGAPRSATIVAQQASILMEITKDTISGLFVNNPLLMERVAAMIEARTQSNQKKIDGLKQSTAVEEKAVVSVLSRIRAFFG